MARTALIRRSITGRATARIERGRSVGHGDLTFDSRGMVGGAPVTQEYADAVGADGYSADASSAVKKAKELIQLKRAGVPA